MQVHRPCSRRRSWVHDEALEREPTLKAWWLCTN